MVTETNSVRTNFSDTINELQRSYNFFIDYFKLDKALFGNTIITIQSSGRRNASSWLSKSNWINDKNETKSEVNISADYLDRGVNEILGTLLHEIAHLKNYIKGIEDCTVSGYHNKYFQKSAIEVGLVVEKLEIGNKGWNKTSLGVESIKAIELLQPNKEVYKFNRVSVKGTGETSKKYLAVFIDVDYKDTLDSLCKHLNLNKKQVVQVLLDDKFVAENL